MDYLALVITLIVGLILGHYLPGYFSEKGKNRAISEDITDITNKIEAVRHQNEVLMEHIRSLTQLRMAALERRLQAHQEAFALWRTLVSELHSDSVSSNVIKCQEWWNQNCLYLSADSRQAFSDAYISAMQHKSLLDSRDGQLVQVNFSKITAAGDVLVKAVELPPIAGGEAKDASPPS